MADIPSKAVYVARHGHTERNKSETSPDRIRGWDNVPLDKSGREEAKQSATDLVNRGIYKIGSSDLDRAADTAKVIGERLNLPVTTGREWRPWNLGKFQGQQSDKVHPELKDYAENKPNTSVPGGESFAEFQVRALKAFKAAITEVLGNKKGTVGKSILIVTHFRDLKLFQAWLAAGAKSDWSVNLSEFSKDDNKPGAIYSLDLSKGNIPTEMTVIEKGA